MEISKVYIEPTPPPVTYHIELTDEEFQVLKAAVAITNFNDLDTSLNSSGIERPRDVLYKIHTDFVGWEIANKKGWK